MTAAGGCLGPTNLSLSFTFSPPPSIRIRPEYACVSMQRLWCPSFPVTDAKIKCSETHARAHVHARSGALSRSIFTHVFNESKRHHHKCDHPQPPQKKMLLVSHKQFDAYPTLCFPHLFNHHNKTPDPDPNLKATSGPSNRQMCQPDTSVMSTPS